MENIFFSKLRSSTRSLHEEVEQLPLSRSIMDSNAQQHVYAEYLSRLQAIHSAVEDLVFPKVSTVITDIGKRKKNDSLRKDLAQLNVLSPLDIQVSSLPGYHDDLHFNLGILYVIEGSTLGGLHILKHLRQSLGPHVPGNFFSVYGEKTGTMWKEFLAQLDRYQSGLTEAERERIIAGALYGFQWVKYIFEQTTVA